MIIWGFSQVEDSNSIYKTVFKPDSLTEIQDWYLQYITDWKDKSTPT